MPRRTQNMNSLLRGRVRTSWNKYNFFNLYKKSQPFFKNMTLYQQKWTSKAETRAYHGEHLTENRWQAIFQSKLEGVAQLDASLKGEQTPTPMVLQTFAALEKRLDFAIYRSMFASSVRQARKYILTKHVKVNGVTILHPGYTLKPGDVFSVTPERVLEALGAKKPHLKESYKIDKEQVIKWAQFVKEAKEDPFAAWNSKSEKQRQRSNALKGKLDPYEFDVESLVTKRISNLQQNMRKNLTQRQNEVSRKTVLNNILSIIRSNPTSITSANFESQFGKKTSTKCFQIYELLGAKNALFNKDTVKDTDLKKEIEKYFPVFKDGKPQGERLEDTNSRKVRQLVTEVRTEYLEKLREDFEHSSKEPSKKEIVQKWASNLRKHPKIPAFSEIEEKGEYYLNLPWQKGVWGRKDASKTYFTPWKPRQFLAPFAVLPKHIEISFPTCHAVYLRDPVARPGESEVISPFSQDVHERAYMYYVRKGM